MRSLWVYGSKSYALGDEYSLTKIQEKIKLILNTKNQANQNNGRSQQPDQSNFKEIAYCPVF